MAIQMIATGIAFAGLTRKELTRIDAQGLSEFRECIFGRRMLTALQLSYDGLSKAGLSR